MERIYTALWSHSLNKNVFSDCLYDDSGCLRSVSDSKSSCTEGSLCRRSLPASDWREIPARWSSSTILSHGHSSYRGCGGQTGDDPATRWPCCMACSLAICHLTTWRGRYVSTVIDFQLKSDRYRWLRGLRSRRPRHGPHSPRRRRHSSYSAAAAARYVERIPVIIYFVSIARHVCYWAGHSRGKWPIVTTATLLTWGKVNFSWSMTYQITCYANCAQKL